MRVKRVAGWLAFPLVAALVAAAAAQAVGAQATHRGAGGTATAATVRVRAESGVGIAIRLHSLLNTSHRATLRELVSPALRPNAAAARATEAPCGQTPGLLCSTVVVPLDRTGVVPGTIPIHVERLPALGVAKGVMFLIAGGPGQGSARSFDLGNPGSASLFRYVFPGYTLVAYDDRGTAASGLLRCPTVEGYVPTSAVGAAVAACADALGPARAFYSTLDHASDLEAVRVSLGVDKVGLYGVSYGTKLALAYALVYPNQVERLLLDSVVPTDRDPFFADSLKAMPGTLSAFCGGGACQTATPDFAGDVAAVANQLEAKPATGKVLQASGATHTVRMNGEDLLSVVVDADLSPGLAAILPAAVHEARLKDIRPLLRIFDIDSSSGIVAEPPEDLSSALNVATNCHDGPFPWPAESAVADRPADLKAAVAALPAGSLGPFGLWAASIGTAGFCITWPAPAGGVTYGNGTVPDVPVLALSGGFDMRTPTTGATAVAAKFPQGRVLVVPGVGHSVVGADPTICTIRNVRAWLSGGAVDSKCPRGNPYLNTVPSFPVGKTPRIATAAQTLVLSTKTIKEAEAIWLTLGDGNVSGLYSGRLTAAGRTFSLTRYSIAPGVELTGKVRFVKFGPPLQFDGTVIVGGAGAAHGLLGLNGDKVGGTLDGQLVGR